LLNGNGHFPTGIWEMLIGNCRFPYRNWEMQIAIVIFHIAIEKFQLENYVFQLEFLIPFKKRVLIMSGAISLEKHA
jgi:hypothetical protein